MICISSIVSQLCGEFFISFRYFFVVFNVQAFLVYSQKAFSFWSKQSELVGMLRSKRDFPNIFNFVFKSCSNVFIMILV